MTDAATMPSGRWGSVTLAGILIAVAVLGVRVLRHREIEPCRTLVEKLTEGETSIASRIAWERLETSAGSVGDDYRSLISDRDRAAYQRAFIRGFAAGFREIRGDVKRLHHWRVADRDAGRLVVAADDPLTRLTLRFGMSRQSPQKLEAILWEP